MFHSLLQRADALPGLEGAPAPSPSVIRRPAPGVDVPFLDGAIERYMLWASDRDQSPKTVKTYYYSYRNFRAFLLDPSVGPTVPVDRVGSVQRWAAWNRGRKLSRFTVNSHWRAVRSFFQYLEAEEGIPNPFRGSKTPGLPDRISKAVEPSELRRILRAAEMGLGPTGFVRLRTIAVIATLIYTGIRKSELLHLTNGDVKLVEGWLIVVDGKGQNGGKSRSVPLPRALQHILAAYRAARTRHGLGPGHILDEEDAATLPFFVSRWNRPLSESQFRRTIADVRRRSGVRFSAHVLRHSYLTMNACNRSVPLPLLQAAAGHAHLETTAGYLKVRPEELRRHFEGFTL